MITTIGSSQNGNHDLATGATVFDANPLDDTNPRRVQIYVAVGDGSDDLDATGGDFELTILLGGVYFDGAAQTKTLGEVARAVFVSEELIVPANTRLQVQLFSPNAGDSDVDVTVTVYDITPASGGGGGDATEANQETIIDLLEAIQGATFDAGTDSLEAIRDNMGTAQTGDAYARLGAPTGASVSADVAAVGSLSVAIKAKTDQMHFTGDDIKATLDGEGISLPEQIVLKASLQVDGDNGDNVVIRVWAENGFGQVVDVGDLDATATASIDVREFLAGASTYLFSESFADTDLINGGWEKSHASPTFAAFKQYVVMIEAEIDGTTYTNEAIVQA